MYRRVGFDVVSFASLLSAPVNSISSSLFRIIVHPLRNPFTSSPCFPDLKRHFSLGQHPFHETGQWHSHGRRTDEWRRQSRARRWKLWPARRVRQVVRPAQLELHALFRGLAELPERDHSVQRYRYVLPPFHSQASKVLTVRRSVRERFLAAVGGWDQCGVCG